MQVTPAPSDFPESPGNLPGTCASGFPFRPSWPCPAGSLSRCLCRELLLPPSPPPPFPQTAPSPTGAGAVCAKGQRFFSHRSLTVLPPACFSGHRHRSFKRTRPFQKKGGGLPALLLFLRRPVFPASCSGELYGAGSAHPRGQGPFYIPPQRFFPGPGCRPPGAGRMAVSGSGQSLPFSPEDESLQPCEILFSGGRTMGNKGTHHPGAGAVTGGGGTWHE